MSWNIFQTVKAGFQRLFGRQESSPFLELSQQTARQVTEQITRNSLNTSLAKPLKQTAQTPNRVQFKAPDFPAFHERVILDFRRNLNWFNSRNHIDHIWRHTAAQGAALLIPVTADRFHGSATETMRSLQAAGWQGFVHFHFINATGHSVGLCKEVEALEQLTGIRCNLSFESCAHAALSDVHRDAILSVAALSRLDSYMTHYGEITVSPALEGVFELPVWGKHMPVQLRTTDRAHHAPEGYFLFIRSNQVGLRYAELLRAYILSALAANLPDRPTRGLAVHAIRLCAERLEAALQGQLPTVPNTPRHSPNRPNAPEAPVNENVSARP